MNLCIFKITLNLEIHTPNTQIHDRSLSWLGTGNLIKSDGVKTSFMGPNLEMKNLEICIIIIVSNNYMIRVISLYTSEQCIVDI